MPFTPKFKNLVAVYKNSIAKYPNNRLFGVKRAGQWVWMTYGEFGKQVDAARGGLAALGVQRGDRVAVIANNRPEWAVGAYATYGLGGQYVPMYEAQLDKDWKFILENCGAKAVIVADEQIRDRIKGLQSELPELQQIIVLDGQGDDGSISFHDLLEKGKANPADMIDPDSKEIAGFIYTSGTTGNPKGVLLTHENLASNVSAIHEVMPMDKTDRTLSFLPWAHSFGQTVELHGMFSMGAEVAIAESVPKIVDNLAEVTPTMLVSVPRIFNKIYDALHKKMDDAGGLKKKLFYAAIENAQYRKKLAAEGRSSGWADLKHAIFDKLVFSKVRERFGGRLKYAFSGGAALSEEVANFIDNLGIVIYEGYGLTETSPIATCNWPGSRKIGSIGRPIPGVEVRIDKHITGDAVNGEIVIYGHNIMKGYHNLPEENAKVFTSDGGFRSGDMGRVDDDGFVWITGRIKEQYKLENGKYVVPGPLEEHLKLSPYIANVMIYGDNRPFNVALVVPDLERMDDFAKEHGLDASDYDKLMQEPSVRKLFADQLEEYSGGFKQFEKVREFKLIHQDFSTENDMLTPTLKLKRRIVLKHYGENLNELYPSDSIRPRAMETA